jgi:hypothetical protein
MSQQCSFMELLLSFFWLVCPPNLHRKMEEMGDRPQGAKKLIAWADSTSDVSFALPSQCWPGESPFRPGRWEFVLDLIGVDGAARWNDVFEEGAEPWNVPLPIAQPLA